MITRSHHRRRAGLIVAGVLAMVLGLASSSQARELVGPEATVARPNILVVVTDDQTDRHGDPADHAERLQPAGAARRQLRQRFRDELVVLPEPRQHPHRAVQPYQRRVDDGRLLCAAGVAEARVEHPGHLAAWRRIPDGADRQVPETGSEPRRPRPTSPPGWDVTDIQMNIDYHGNDGYYNYDDYENGRIVHYGTAPEAYSTRVLHQEGALSSSQPTPPIARPKFAYLAYPAPHGPYTHRSARRAVRCPACPSRAARPTSARPTSATSRGSSASSPLCTVLRDPALQLAAPGGARRRMLLSVDRGLGQLFADLTRTGQMKNTIIIYISDNGCADEAPTGMYRQGAALRGVDRRADACSAGMRSASPVRCVHLGPFALNIDIAPTITGAIGLDHPRRLRRHQPAAARQGHRDVVAEGLPGRAPPGRGRPTRAGPRSAPCEAAAISYAEYATGEKELYDLVNDPYELTNRAGSPSLATVQAGLPQPAADALQPAAAGMDALERRPPSVRSGR